MWLRSFMKGVFKIYCSIVYRVKVVGNENIPDEGAYILCANHVHAMDAISYVVNEKRMFYIMAKSELFEGKFSFYGDFAKQAIFSRGSSLDLLSKYTYFAKKHLSINNIIERCVKFGYKNYNFLSLS